MFSMHDVYPHKGRARNDSAFSFMPACAVLIHFMLGIVGILYTSHIYLSN